MAYESGGSLPPGESEFQRILRDNSFLTAMLNQYTQDSSIQDGKGSYIAVPNIVAVDRRTMQGWAFEIKDESRTQLISRELPSKSYKGRICVLETYKGDSYLAFSQVFNVPCLIAVKSSNEWRVAFLTMRQRYMMHYNDYVLVSPSPYHEDYLILFDAMDRLEYFLSNYSTIRSNNWR